MIVHIPTQPSKSPTIAHNVCRETESVSLARILPSNPKMLLSKVPYPYSPLTFCGGQN